ncbi:hypothetical protein N7453_011134 [Penicillium expansum]|nr:hypothetical protein N7453_011134 [Penicillium expansum]
MATNDEWSDIRADYTGRNSQVSETDQRASIPIIKDPEVNDVDSEDDEECSSDTHARNLRRLTPTNLDSKKSTR